MFMYPRAFGMDVHQSIVYLVGTAGCGKSCLAAAFANWMQEQGYSANIVNLDPGADELPYEPTLDIRNWFSLATVMAEHGLGPNGAQIAVADMLALNSAPLSQEISELDADYILVDTPGQIELFAFRSSSRVVVDRIGREGAVMAFLFDPNLVKQPSGLISAQMLATTVEFRLTLPFLSVLSKCDLLRDDELARIAELTTDPFCLMSALDSEPGSPHTLFSNELVKAMESMGSRRELLPVSAETGFGMEDIYTKIQMLFAGGEDLEKR